MTTTATIVQTAATPALAPKLRALADAMQKDIHAKLHPGIANQNLTPRRVRIADGMRKDGHRLELVQRALRRMAAWHEAPSGSAVCQAHTTLRTRAAFEALDTETLEMLAGGARVETAAEKTQKLEAALVGSKIPGFFPTPKSVCRTLVGLANLEDGQGDLADAIRDASRKVPCGTAGTAEVWLSLTLDTIELNHTLRGILDAKGHRVLMEHDFLAYRPSTPYDRIVMNPPFEKLADITHVRHAFEMLAPGGRLVSVVGEGAFVRNDARAEAFRNWLTALDADIVPLPSGSFTGKHAFRQTGANSRIVVIDKPAAAAPAPELRLHLAPEYAAGRAEDVPLVALPPPTRAARQSRAQVDWRAAGLKAAETRRRRLAEQARGAA